MIGILAAVLVPVAIHSRKSAYDTQAKACLKELSNGQAMYNVTNYVYAEERTDLPTHPENACRDVDVVVVTANSATFEYTASHIGSGSIFGIAAGQGIVEVE